MSPPPTAFPDSKAYATSVKGYPRFFDAFVALLIRPALHLLFIFLVHVQYESLTLGSKQGRHINTKTRQNRLDNTLAGTLAGSHETDIVDKAKLHKARKAMRYTVILEPEEEGGFHIWCPL